MLHLSTTWGFGLLTLKVVFNALEQEWKSTSMLSSVNLFIMEESHWKWGVFFPRLFFIQNNSLVCTGKFHSMCRPTGGQLGTSQETARRHLEKQVAVLSRLKKHNYMTVDISQKFRRCFRKTTTNNNHNKTEKTDCSFLIFQNSWILPTSRNKQNKNKKLKQ